MKIAIVGAGLMGRVLALRLYENGFTNISIFEKDHNEMNSSPAFIAAGMLAPFNESAVSGGDLIYELGTFSISLWTKYLQTINAQNLLNDKGCLVISENNFIQDAEHHIAKINFNIKQSINIKDFSQPQKLNRESLFKLEPELNFSLGYFFSNEGALDSAMVMKSLGQYLKDRMSWNDGASVYEIQSDGGFSYSINALSFEEKFDLVFDTRGLGASLDVSDLRGVRGEVIRVHAPEVNISRSIRLIHPRHNIYIVPYGNKNYIIGATEIEAKDFSEISVRSTLQLLSSLYFVHSGFAEARIISTATNCRPAFSDNMPQIRCQNKLITLNGLYRHGFLLTPALVEEVIEYLKTGEKKTLQVWC